MLFNSYVYIALFLPLTFAVYRAALARGSANSAIGGLVVASLVYYAWWDPRYLTLILASMLVNFALGRWLAFARKENHSIRARTLLAVGIATNLSALAYFKYAGFFAASVNAMLDTEIPVLDLVLPLAISFFTFQQIAYLVDVYRGEALEYRFLHYALFVTFFPQLIAGPIVHHKEMLPQFATIDHRDVASDFAVGSTIFFIGLFKKLVLADGIAPYADQVFAEAGGGPPSLLFAWGGALCFTLQLYFDFSGYSDMAVGSARLFGVRLPLNFHSPYKSTNIAEFWRRWHMTLSRFLRDYVYIALGGNRHGSSRRFANLFATMLLGGLWHGAGWTFVAWGALHGCYLVIYHAWQRLQGGVSRSAGRGRNALAWAVTFLAVVVSWVLFRAEDFDHATSMLGGMCGLEGIALPNAVLTRLGEIGVVLISLGVHADDAGGRSFVLMWVWICALLPVVVVAPNTQQIMSGFSPALMVPGPGSAAVFNSPWPGRAANFQFSRRWAVASAAIAVAGVAALGQASEFLYYQF